MGQGWSQNWAGNKVGDEAGNRLIIIRVFEETEKDEMRKEKTSSTLNQMQTKGSRESGEIAKLSGSLVRITGFWPKPSDEFSA